MTFPTIDGAVAYLKSKLSDFYSQKAKIIDRIRKIKELRELAQKSNDQEALGRLIVLRAQEVMLLQEHHDMEDRIKPFVSAFGLPGPPQLGFIPIAAAAGVGAIGLASMLYLYYERLQTQQKALDMVAQGMLSASEADAIVNPGLLKTIAGGGVGGLSIMALGALAVFFFFRKSL